MFSSVTRRRAIIRSLLIPLVFVVSKHIRRKNVEMDGERYGFFLMGLHSDYTLLYGPGCEEKKSTKSLYGLTLVSFDFRDTRRVKYNGLCLRKNFVPINDSEEYNKVRNEFIFRDKCGNFRNFVNIPAHVSTDVSAAVARKMPRRAKTLESYYRHEIVSVKSRDPANGEEDDGTGFAPFFERLTVFAKDQLRWMDPFVARDETKKIKIFHKLPECTSVWLPKLWSDLFPNVDFVAVDNKKIKATYPIMSQHCRFRPWHNVALCEICLFDEYGPLLIDALLDNETVVSSQNECGEKTN